MTKNSRWSLSPSWSKIPHLPSSFLVVLLRTKFHVPKFSILKYNGNLVEDYIMYQQVQKFVRRKFVAYKFFVQIWAKISLAPPNDCLLLYVCVWYIKITLILSYSAKWCKTAARCPELVHKKAWRQWTFWLTCHQLLEQLTLDLPSETLDIRSNQMLKRNPYVLDCHDVLRALPEVRSDGVNLLCKCSIRNCWKSRRRLDARP